MRPKGLIVLLIVVVLVGVAWYFLSDDFFEHQLEKTGTNMVGAKVEIDNFQYSLFGLSVSMDRLQVTNPNDTWKNMFETGRIAFDMEAAPLIRKKVVINEVAVERIRIGTKRETDGYVEMPEDTEPGWVEEAATSLKSQLADAPILNLGVLKRKVNVDSLMQIFNIQTPAKIEQARLDATQTFQTWETTISEFRPKNDLAKIEQQISEIKPPQQISNVDELLATAEQTKKTIDALNAMKQDIEAKKKTAGEDFQRITATFSQIDNWVKDDFDAIKSKANIGEFNAQNVARMLFGDIVFEPTIGILKYVNIGRRYMPIAQKVFNADKVEKPPRFAGQDIPFPLFNDKPKFLMEQVIVSAETNQEDTSKVLAIGGRVEGITSQPKVYGKPLTFNLGAKLPGTNRYSLTGEVDHTGDIPKEGFELRATGMHFGTIELPQKSPFLPSGIVADRGGISANFNLVGKELDFSVSLNATPVSFAFAQELADGNVIAKLTRDVFTSIDQLQLKAGVVGPTSDLKLRISSNIDDILAARIKGVIGESIALAREEIRKRIEQEVAPRKAQALQFVEQKKTQINTEIDKIRGTIDTQLAKVEAIKQDIETEIAKKKGEGLDKAKDKLKDLLKKP